MGHLRRLLNLPLLDGGSPTGPPLTLDQVQARVAPYIASLNGARPGVQHDREVAENDIAIFNTALILEYLEYEFYTSNYSKFFS